MKNLNDITNFKRVNLYGDEFPGDDYNGAFVIDKHKNGEFYLVIVSNGQGFDHVSVTSHRKNGANIKKCPSFEEMQMIKEKIFAEDEVVFQLHPREEDYINTHPYCLHLWKPNNCNMSVPPLSSINDDELTEKTYFEHEGIIVKIKTGEIDEWQVARVYCSTKDGKLIKSSPNWDIMCKAKASIFGEEEAAFQFMSSTNDSKHSSLDIWYPKSPEVMPPLPDALLVGVDKKLVKKR